MIVGFLQNLLHANSKIIQGGLMIIMVGEICVAARVLR
jgi:hypothetical protein